MEYVPYSTLQLDYLARIDPVLSPIFRGVYGADQLPSHPLKRKPCAYIVNLDPIQQAGTHWLGIFTEKGTCEIMDSYGLPLQTYKSSPVIRWIFSHWEDVSSNAKTLQEKDSNSCGQYVLIYLKCRCRGVTMDDFTSMFKRHDFVANDHKVGTMLETLVKDHLKDLRT